MTNDNERHTVWMAPEVWAMVEKHYHEDNCTKKNEYIAKAIRFYSGYLDTKNADSYLPRVLSDVLEGKLGALGRRIGRMLFKLAVEMSMMMNVLASEVDVSPEALERLRGRCIQEVKKTGGAVTFADAMKYQHSE